MDHFGQFSAISPVIKMTCKDILQTQAKNIAFLSSASIGLLVVVDHFGGLGGTWGAISPVRPSRESGFEPAAVPWPASNWTAPISSQVRLQIIANFQTVSYIWIVFSQREGGQAQKDKEVIQSDKND